MQPFSISFASVSSAEKLLADQRVLALIEFGSVAAARNEEPRRITVGLPQLGPTPLVEVWKSATPVESIEGWYAG